MSLGVYLPILPSSEALFIAADTSREAAVESVFLACSLTFQMMAMRSPSNGGGLSTSHPPARVRQAYVSGIMSATFGQIDDRLDPKVAAAITTKVFEEVEGRKVSAYGEAGAMEEFEPLASYFGEGMLYRQLRRNWESSLRSRLQPYAYTDLVQLDDG